MSIHLTHEQKIQFEGLFQQTHQMHKEEIEEAYGYEAYDEEGNPLSAEQYYKETYEHDTKR